MRSLSKDDYQDVILGSREYAGIMEARDNGPVVISARDIFHDAGNAVTAARLYAQFLQQCLITQRCPADDLFDALRVIESNLDHAADLLTWVPQYSRSTPIDIVHLAQRAVSQVPPQRAEDVSVRWFGDDAPVGEWNAVAVSRILANLLSNAAKYSAPGTPIVVEVTRVESGVELTVRDQGIGVPEEELEAIFAGHRTERAREMADGKGYGLQSSHRLAKALGGHLRATQEVNGGLALHLLLPSTPASTSAQDLPSTANE